MCTRVSSPGARVRGWAGGDAKYLGKTHFSIEHLSYTLGKSCILGAFAEAELHFPEPKWV
jgi:hypothetical protein